jgi:sulfur-oxidizing protein SoxY
MASGTWPTTLMNVSSRVWFKENIDRFRFRVMHPMDTGLADGVPEFYLQNINITDQAGVVVAKIKTYQPLSENPVFTIDVNKELELPLFLQGVDNNGNRLKAELKP